MSLGQGAGTIVGAVIGSIIAPGAGTFIGAGIGGAIGGFIDPPDAGEPESKFETEDLQFNTFSNTLPVPVLFGTQKWNPNVIFIGDTKSQVEVVGQQTVQQGKNSEERDIEKLIYYADFALALCEGPIQGIVKVEREDQDITDQEGDFWTVSLGDDNESLPQIVVNNPNPIEHPIPWEHTAKLLFSGRIGEVNRLPRVSVTATGPDVSITRTGSPSALPSSVRFDSLYHDDLTDRLTLIIGDRQIQTMTREGADSEIATLPGSTDYVAEIAAYDGRTDSLIVITKLFGSSGGERRILVGERDWTSSDDWEIFIPQHSVWNRGIEGWVLDDSSGYLWAVFQDPVEGWVLCGVSLLDGSDQPIHYLNAGGASTQDIRSLWYDKPYRRFFLLYTDAGTSQLRIRRFSLEDPGDDEEMVLDYGHVNPIAVWRTGDLVGVFDRGSSQPIRYFEWGRSQPRESFGSLDVTLDFEPRFISDFHVDWDAESVVGVTDGASVQRWRETSGGVANDLEQGTSTERPVYRASVVDFDNSPALEFDGTDDDFDSVIGSLTLDRSKGYTIFVVLKPQGSDTQDSRVFSMQSETTTGPPYQQYQEVAIGYGSVSIGGQAQTGYVYFSQQGTAQIGAPLGVNEAGVFAVRVKAGEARAWKNGDVVGTWSSGSVNASTVDTRFTVGRWSGGANAVDSSVADDYHFQGQIARIMIFERDLDDDEMDSVHDYLKQKYRIAYVPSYSEYLTPGDKLIFGNPRQVFFSPGLAQLMVLDEQTGSSWSLYHFHWDGDNWSQVTRDQYIHILFSEESSPAGGVYTQVTSPVYGLGAPTGFVDLYSFERVSGFCKEPVDMRFYISDPPTIGPRYQLDYIQLARRKSEVMLSEMTSAFNGFLIYSEGKVELHVERDLGYVDGEYDDDTIIEGSFGFEELGRENRWSMVTVECIDRRDSYRKKPVIATAEWERDLYGEVRRRTISLTGVTRLRQGGNIAWSSLLGSTVKRFACQFSVAAHGLKQKVADVISLSVKKTGWVKKLFIITSISEAENEEITFQCLEYIPLVTETAGFPLQDGQSGDALIFGKKVKESNFDPVQEPARFRTIENTITGEIWLLASRPYRGGPYNALRFHARWERTLSPGSTFYPGAIPLTGGAYTMVLQTKNITPSAVLDATVQSADTSIVLTGVLGEPPESAFDLVIYNEDITQIQFNNPNGNGQYERIEGSVYSDSTKTVTVQNRGVGTPAQTHTVHTVKVGAIFTRRQFIAGEMDDQLTGNDQYPLPIYWDGSNLPFPINPAEFLETQSDEVYIGFDATEFESASLPGNGGVNLLKFVVTSSDVISDPEDDFLPKYEYSVGGGVWKELRIDADDTDGFRKSGSVTFETPTDWVKMNEWRSGYTADRYFSTIQGLPSSSTGSNPTRYYIRITRQDKPAYAAGPFAPGSASPRTIEMVGQNSNAAFGYNSPLVFFLPAGLVNVYDFISVEQGHVLSFKCQPVGKHNQSILLDDLDAVQHNILNLAGE